MEMLKKSGSTLNECQCSEWTNLKRILKFHFRCLKDESLLAFELVSNRLTYGSTCECAQHFRIDCWYLLWNIEMCCIFNKHQKRKGKTLKIQTDQLKIRMYIRVNNLCLLNHSSSHSGVSLHWTYLKSPINSNLHRILLGPDKIRSTPINCRTIDK